MNIKEEFEWIMNNRKKKSKNNEWSRSNYSASTPYPYEIFKVTPLLAGLQHKQPFHPCGFTQESPARF